MIVVLWAASGLFAWSLLSLPLAIIVGRALAASGLSDGEAPQAPPGFVLAA